MLLYPDQSLIFLNLQLAISRLPPQLNSILSPLCKLSFCHFTFHKTSVVLLVATIVYFPDRIAFELLLEVMAENGEIELEVYRDKIRK